MSETEIPYGRTVLLTLVLRDNKFSFGAMKSLSMYLKL
jgi:hypothetical protein